MEMVLIAFHFSSQKTKVMEMEPTVNFNPCIWFTEDTNLQLGRQSTLQLPPSTENKPEA